MTPSESSDNDNDPREPRPNEPVAPPKVLGRAPKVELPKRFYTAVMTAPAGNAFTINLDGRSIKTPKKSALIVPTQALAEAIAVEWQEQGERIDPATMPLTRLANTTLDAVIPNAAAVRADIVAFAGTDALCYRATGQAALIARQAANWDPILDWAHTTLGAKFTVVSGILHVTQPPETLAAIARAVDTFTPWQIAPLHVMTTITGSAVVAIAIAQRHLDAQTAWAAAHVDEDWQIEMWGTDEEAAQRRAQRWREMQAAAVMLETLF